MKAIHTSNVPAAIGPYSQAIYHKGLLCVTGQIGIDPSTNKLASSFEKQVELIFHSLSSILSASDMTFANVMKVTVYLEDICHFETLNKIYARFFSEPYPARETVQVARIPLNAAVEISLMAHE
ncbi:MAG: Rid family detoxifying hydrolase [Candidatus Cloacimonetes bacterium]|nr:Rid family detoxifying hydrolase [Candidatus Cloacimonadota bacterium]